MSDDSVGRATGQTGTDRTGAGPEPSDRDHGALDGDGSGDGGATGGQAAAIIETHVSMLFFVGGRVYKLRKQVQFDFLDFRLRSERQRDCQREVDLNRRLAADVYLGVADLLMDGEPIDHMVVMRRMPEDRRLSTLADNGADLEPLLHQVAERLVHFHRSAERSPEISADASDQAIRTIWDGNFHQTQSFRGSVLDDRDEAEIRSLAPRWIAGRKPLFDKRIASGCVCDGHGDLQAEDIFCLEDGARILDCVEFSDTLRHGDVCADVAFLVMDLERLGHTQAATWFLHEYERLAGSRFPDTLVHFYCAARAYVRATVACLRSRQGVDVQSDARRLQALALDHLRKAQVRIVLIGGLPGNGKSTLAAGLSTITGWKVLRTDEIRRDLGPHGTKADVDRATAPQYLTGDYRPAATNAVYQEVLRRAEEEAGWGESVILDASWIDASWRDAARLVADRTSSDLVELWCDASPEEAEARIARRQAARDDPSEATAEVRQAMSRAMDPWPSAHVLDTSGMTPEEMVTRAVDLVGHRPD